MKKLTKKYFILAPLKNSIDKNRLTQRGLNKKIFKNLEITSQKKRIILNYPIINSFQYYLSPQQHQLQVAVCTVI